MEHNYLRFIKSVLTAQWLSNGPECVLCGNATKGRPTFITKNGRHFCHECVNCLMMPVDNTGDEALYRSKRNRCREFEKLMYRKQIISIASDQKYGKLDMPPVKRVWFPFLAKSEPAIFVGRIRLMCVACYDWIENDELDGVVKTECGHIYCQKCIIKMVDTCLRDETCYPLKCCSQIMSNDSVSRKLPRDVCEAFQKRSAELDVLPVKKRVYCPYPSCSEFAGSTDSAVNSYLVCNKCDIEICIQCRQVKHHGKPCNFQEDSDTIALRELAKQQNWKVCPGCKWIIDRQLNEGCYYMTCRCGTHFCYVCCGVITRELGKICNCRDRPLKGDIIRDNIQPSRVDIHDILIKSKDKNIRTFALFLTSLENLEYANLLVHVPCDIENCCKSHAVRIDIDFKQIMAHISHESSSSEVTQSSETVDCQEELLLSDLPQL